LSATS